MSQLLQLPVIIFFLGLVVILLILCGVLAWITRISFRLNKVDAPNTKSLFAISFLQILTGVITVLVIRAIKDDPLIALGAGLVIMLVSGIFLMKLILKIGWKQSLRIWSIAAAVQLVLAPVCSVVMAMAWVMILLWLYPPQY
jgi:hypothetical protein